jgi:hypothetical protein
MPRPPKGKFLRLPRFDLQMPDARRQFQPQAEFIFHDADDTNPAD